MLGVTKQFGQKRSRLKHLGLKKCCEQKEFGSRLTEKDTFVENLLVR